jgi:uncharacterized protein (UPF0276 family)
LPVSGQDAGRAVTRIGVAYRAALAHWIDAGSPHIECVEVNAEDFYKGGRAKLEVLRRHAPLLVHTRRLSPGTPGPLDADELAWFATLVREAKPLWISEHLGFRCTPEIDLACVVPVSLTEETLATFVSHVRQIVDACETQLLLENIASPLVIRGHYGEPEFLNRLCEQTGCGVLLDLTALLVNSRNHRFDPERWLRALDLGHVAQIHIGGCRERNRSWEDMHDAPIGEELWTLAEAVFARQSVRAVVLERDARFPVVSEIERELDRLRVLSRRARAAPTRTAIH